MKKCSFQIGDLVEDTFNKDSCGFVYRIEFDEEKRKFYYYVKHIRKEAKLEDKMPWKWNIREPQIYVKVEK